jgi:GWxTD domain-containing protein
VSSRSSARAALTLLTAWTIASVPGPASAQYPNPGPPTQMETPVPGTSADRPRFSVDATVEPSGGVPTVRLDYRLSRSELLFERKQGGGYHAAYEIKAIFYRKKGERQVTGDVFVREMNVRTYAETRPIGGDIIDHVELPVPPEKYDVKVLVRDLVAERTSGTTIDVEVPKQAAGPLWFTDLSFGTVKQSAASVTTREALDPNPSRRYSDNIASLAVFGEIVDSRPSGKDDSYKIQWRILNDTQDRVIEKDTTLVRNGGRTAFLIRPNAVSLAPGSYRFVVELKAPLIPWNGKKKSPPVRREKGFDVLQSVASIAADPRSTFDVLRYIVEPGAESDQLEAAKTEDQRREFWEKFWRRRDPTPDTPENEAMDEFYRRVQYATQHFSAGRTGWKTDMGRIYIKYGQPDEVVRSPFNFDRPPEEVWYYYKERRTFYFVDRQGFGLYEQDDSRSQP